MVIGVRVDRANRLLRLPHDPSLLLRDMVFVVLGKHVRLGYSVKNIWVVRFAGSQSIAVRRP